MKTEAYSASCLKRLFDRKKVSPVLDFHYDAEQGEFLSAINRISVSGVQEKLSAVVRKGKIILTPEGEQGKYIIKPASGHKHLRFRQQLPANEHLTMEIARKVFKINTAEHALVYFADGEVAYLTKRFDIAEDGSKIGQEDFASLAQKTALTHGKDFKYTGSYEEAAALLRARVSAWQVEMSKFFKLVVFNYLFANGDAHLKNFSLQQSPGGDYLLAPAYDLLNTSIHINDGDFALQGGLIPTCEHSEVYRRTEHPCKLDFVTFGKRIGMLPRKVDSIIEEFSQEHPMVDKLIADSYLDDRTKRMYMRSYWERLQRFLQTT